jgi:hypothetical protein
MAKGNTRSHGIRQVPEVEFFYPGQDDKGQAPSDEPPVKHKATPPDHEDLDRLVYVILVFHQYEQGPGPKDDTGYNRKSHVHNDTWFTSATPVKILGQTDGSQDTQSVKNSIGVDGQWTKVE